MTDEYNGWSNRETWAVSLHIDNDEGMYREVRERALEIGKEGNGDGVDFTQEVSTFAEYLENLCDECWDNLVESESASHRKALGMMFHDIGSTWRVNWREIAKHWIDTFAEGSKEA